MPTVGTVCMCRGTVEAYSSEIGVVIKGQLGSICLTMGMENDRLIRLHEEMTAILRVKNYPPCSMPDQVLGLGPHSDATSVTIPNALVVNIGDVLEVCVRVCILKEFFS